LKNIIKNLDKKKLIQNGIILAIFGLGIHLILPQIVTLEKSWRVLLNMLPYAVGLAFLMQVISYFGNGYLLKKTLEISHKFVALGRSTLIVMGAASISLVAGGTVGSSAAIFRWTKSGKGSVGGATLASLLPSLFNSLMLVIFSVFGLVHLFLVHDLSRTQIIGFSITLIFLGVIIAISILASRNRNRAILAILWISKHWTRLNRKSFDPAQIQDEAERLFFAWDELWEGKWHYLALGSLINITFDLLTLYCLFIASGQNVPFGELLSGYALPLLLGRLAFVLPGGVGVVESSMAALYTSLGIPNATAVVVILGYRLISFWIPSILGFPIATYLQNTIKNA